MEEIETRTIRKVMWRLMPFLVICYFVAYLDRVNVGFAKLQMNAALGLSEAAYGFGAGLFFIAYFLLEVPSNLALDKFGARLWIARIMFSWGLISALFAYIQPISRATGISNEYVFFILRFLLGIAEAGFFPGAILFLTLWVPAKHRSRVLSIFYLAQPLTIVIGAPIAAALLQAHGVFGLSGWRVMFFGVSVPAIVVGIITWFYLPDRPADARWLTGAEKAWLGAALAAEEKGKAHSHTSGAWDALRNGRVWLLSLVYFGLVYGLYALAFFLPTIIAGFEAQFGTKFSVMEKGLITAIPYLPAAIALFVWSRDASRRGVRTWHVALPALVGAASVPAALYMGSPVTTVAVITVTACAIFSALPNFWAIPARFLSGAGAASGIGLINSAGNVAGFAAPFITGAVKDATGSYHAPMLIVGAFMLLSAVLVAVVAGQTEEDPVRRDLGARTA